MATKYRSVAIEASFLPADYDSVLQVNSITETVFAYLVIFPGLLSPCSNDLAADIGGIAPGFS